MLIPEFDTPGHVRTGYRALDPPILTTCYDNTGKPLSGIAGTGPLNPTLNATYDFLTKFYKELQGLPPNSRQRTQPDPGPLTQTRGV